LWFCRRPAAGLAPWRLRAEWALVLVVMLCAMPVLRRYHLVLLTPVIAILLAATHHVGRTRPWSKIALAAVVAMFIAQWAVFPRVFGWPYFVEAIGIMWLATAGLAIPLVLLGRLVGAGSLQSQSSGAR
jgi:hypothetical protein